MLKIVTLLLVTLCFGVKMGIAQDTLSCKKDLTWDKTDRFYYKTNDASKAKYTGPAKCFPQKGVENRGYLKNGSWEGVVYGYKEGRLLGYSNFKEGFYKGLTIKFNEQGKTKDSIIIQDAIEVYHKTITYTKNNEISKATETIRDGDKLTLIYHKYEGDEIEREIQRFTKNKKDGAWETTYPELNENEKTVFKHGEYEFYENGALSFERLYDGGQLYQANFYTKGKKTKAIVYHGDISKIESEASFVNGKISGEVKHYDENGKLNYTEKYENGKLIETIEQ